MAKTRDNYQVSGRTPQELVMSLNFLLQRIADRMDRIEGIRGTASIESDLEMNANRIREVGEGTSGSDGARVDDLVGTTLDLGLLTAGQVEVTGKVEVFDPDGNLIHSLE